MYTSCRYSQRFTVLKTYRLEQKVSTVDELHTQLVAGKSKHRLSAARDP